MSRDILMVLRFRWTLDHHRVHLVLAGLGMVSRDLFDQSNIVLAASEFIVEFGVMQSQGDKCSELCD